MPRILLLLYLPAGRYRRMATCLIASASFPDSASRASAARRRLFTNAHYPPAEPVADYAAQYCETRVATPPFAATPFKRHRRRFYLPPFYDIAAIRWALSLRRAKFYR